MQHRTTVDRTYSLAELDLLCPLPPDPDDLPRILTRRRALALGFSAQAIGRRLASGRWRRVLPSTYLTVGTLTDHDRLEAALAYAGPGAALSGRAALFAEGIRRVSMPARVLVLVPMTNYAESQQWTQVRRTARPIVRRQWMGPARVEVARAAADEAMGLTRIDDVRALVSRVVRDRHCTVGELAAELEAGPRRGSAHLRRALVEVGWGTGSAPEARAARLLRQAKITGWEPNVTVALGGGATRELDFYWKQLRAGLEIDSVEYHFEPGDWAGTWNKHLELSKIGMSVIHRPPSALDNAAAFCADISDWLAARRADLVRGLA